MSEIALVLFDMNDVLCRYDRARRIAGLAAVSGRTPEAVEAAIWGSGFEDQADAGAMSAEDYLTGYGERLGRPVALADWTAALRAAIPPLEETLALARVVRRRTRIAALTNNNLLVARAIGAVFPALPPLFGAAFHVSAEFRARKPDPEVYRRCLARLGVEPAATLFVDDSPTNVAGAEAAGLMAHRFTTAEALAAAFRRLNILPANDRRTRREES